MTFGNVFMKLALFWSKILISVFMESMKSMVSNYVNAGSRCKLLTGFSPITVFAQRDMAVELLLQPKPVLKCS